MSRINLKECTIEDMEDECSRVQGTQYGHNMIGIICKVAEDRFGEDAANELFNTYQQ